MCADTLGLSTLRRDAYTGPNRCWPCTALNIAILAVTAVVVGWATVALFGVAVAVAGFAAVWLRGYLVPYTPRVTGRVLPVLPGDRFGHATPPPGAPSETAATEGGDSDQSNPKATPAVYGQGVSAGSTHGAAGAAVVEELLAADVLVDEGTTLALASAFHEAWRATIVDLRETESSPEMLATGLSAVIPWVADASVVTDDGRQWIQLTDADERIASETWLSLPTAAADLTAVQTLADRTDLTPSQRMLAAPPLRLFLERCPRCDADLDVSSPRACCGSPRYVADGIEAVLACSDCDELVTVFEIDPDAE